MWTPKKIKHVDDLVTRLSRAADKDELADGLLTVEEETGYKIEFIYDIFTEAVLDEDLTRDQANDPDLIRPIWDQVITTAYEYDY